MNTSLFKEMIQFLSFLFYFLLYFTTIIKYYPFLIQIYNIVIGSAFFIQFLYDIYPQHHYFYVNLQKIYYIIMYISIYTTYYVYKNVCLPEITGIVENLVSICTISGILLTLGNIKITNHVCFPLFLCSSFAFLFNLSMFQSLLENYSFLFTMVCIAGFFYSFGFTCLLKKRLNILPGIIGYHEIFQLFVFLGTSFLFLPLLAI